MPTLSAMRSGPEQSVPRLEHAPSPAAGSHAASASAGQRARHSGASPTSGSSSMGGSARVRPQASSSGVPVPRVVGRPSHPCDARAASGQAQRSYREAAPGFARGTVVLLAHPGSLAGKGRCKGAPVLDAPPLRPSGPAAPGRAGAACPPRADAGERRRRVEPRAGQKTDSPTAAGTPCAAATPRSMADARGKDPSHHLRSPSAVVVVSQGHALFGSVQAARGHLARWPGPGSFRLRARITCAYISRDRPCRGSFQVRCCTWRLRRERDGHDHSLSPVGGVRCHAGRAAAAADLRASPLGA